MVDSNKATRKMVDRTNRATREMMVAGLAMNRMSRTRHNNLAATNILAAPHRKSSITNNQEVSVWVAEYGRQGQRRVYVKKRLILTYILCTPLKSHPSQLQGLSPK